MGAFVVCRSKQRVKPRESISRCVSAALQSKTAQIAVLPHTPTVLRRVWQTTYQTNSPFLIDPSDFMDEAANGIAGKGYLAIMAYTRHSALGTLYWALAIAWATALPIATPAALADEPCPVGPPAPRPLRLIRIVGKHCPNDSVARPIVMPDLFEAKLFDSVGSDRRDNAFGINDSGVVVGSFGKRLNPCDVLDPEDPTEPHAFVRLPRSSALMGLGGGLAGLLAYDIHSAAGLSAAPLGSAIHRSTANGVSESSRYVVGQVGTAFETDGVAWLWDLQGATVLSIASQDLTDDIAGPLAPSLPALWRSEAHAVMHGTGDSEILVAGAVDSVCAEEDLLWGFRLEMGDPLGAIYLLPAIKPLLQTQPPSNYMSTDAIARDIGMPPAAYGQNHAMPLGYDWGNVGLPPTAGGNPSPCASGLGSTSCSFFMRGSAGWIFPWDEDIELGLPDDGIRGDRVDISSPAIDPPSTWPPNESSPGREAYSLNAQGEWVGKMWRTDQYVENNLCFQRGYFAWAEPSTTQPEPEVFATDLDEASGYTVVDESAESRAEALASTKIGRSRLLVGGEALSENPTRAVLWCGYKETWDRRWLDELVRFDDRVVLESVADILFDYQFDDCSLAQRITVIHDMNAYGQMVVTLRLFGSQTDNEVVEFPCVVTLASDFNGDFRVDSRDLSLLSAAAGTLPAQPAYDLNADGDIDSEDVAWLLGDYSGSTPCDLHTLIPCEMPPVEAPASPAQSSGEELESASSLSVPAAIQALGFSSAADFFAWIASASEEQAEAATHVLWNLVEGES